MDGASRAFASPTEITLGGQKFTVHGRTADNWGLIGQRIRSLRPDLILEAKDHMVAFGDNPTAQRWLLEIAMDQVKTQRFVTKKEAYEYLDTPEGCAFAYWLAIKDENGQPTEDEILRLYLTDVEMIAETVGKFEAQKAVVRKMQAAMDRASGSDELGNSTGPSPTTGTEAGMSSESPGEKS